MCDELCTLQPHPSRERRDRRRHQGKHVSRKLEQEKKLKHKKGGTKH
jgi:hypothetical protein